MELDSIYFKECYITEVYLGNNLITSFSKTTVWNYEYTGNFQMFLAPKTGTYKLECWGAEGGWRNDTSAKREGKGGYACGEINLTKGTALYVYVGQCGNTVDNTSSYSFNGGGKGATKNQAGGGATDFRLTSGSWNNTASLRSRIIVAGGGGSVGAKSRAGGAGGGRDGISRTESYGTGGSGGSQVSAGSSYGEFGIGGSGTAKDSGYGGAGGGGWYGGGGAVPDSSGDDDRGGGGGSGFVLVEKEFQYVPSGYTPNRSHFLANTQLIDGTKSLPSPEGMNLTGRSAHGYARVTLLR